MKPLTIAVLFTALALSPSITDVRLHIEHVSPQERQSVVSQYAVWFGLLFLGVFVYSRLLTKGD